MQRILRIIIPLVSALLFSFSFQLSALPQTPDAQALENDQIEIPFGWKVGDRRRYSVERIDYQNGTAKQTKKSIFTVEIVSESEEFSVAKCNIMMVVAPNQRAIVEAMPAAKRMIDLYRDLDILVRIGNDGTFQGFENENEIKVVFQKSVDAAKDAVKDVLDEINLDDDKKAFLYRVMKEATDFDTFQNNLLAPLQLMLMITATSHSKTEVYKRASTTEMMSARDLPTVEEYRIEGIDSDQKIVTVAYSEIMEGEIAAKMLKDEIEALTKRLDPGNEETVEIEGVIFKTNGKFEMNYENGWPRKIEWKVRANDFKTGSLEDKRLIHVTNIELPVGTKEDK